MQLPRVVTGVFCVFVLIVVPLAGVLIFTLLYLTYSNVVDALRVFTGVPFGWVGGIFALWIRDMPFSISAAIGFIALSGVAVLDDMILVSYVRQLRQKIDAEDVLQSVFKSFFIRHADGQFEPTGWDSLWTLLSVIAVRKCCKHWKFYQADRRDIGREAPIEDGSSAAWEPFDREPTPDEAVAVADTVEQVMRGLDTRGREILSLRLQGRLVEEIAGDVGCAERTVRRVLDRVKGRLQELEKTPQEPRHV